MHENRKHFYDLGPFSLSVSDRLLLRLDGSEVGISPKTFEVLQCLIQKRIESPGSYVSRDEFNRQVWDGASVSENSLDQALSDLRDVFGESASCIRNKRGKGWRFAGDVVERTAEQAGTAPLAIEPQPAVPGASPLKAMRWGFVSVTLAVLVSVVLALLLFSYFRAEPRITAFRRLTNSGFPKTGPLVTDGGHLYYIETRGTRHVLVALPVAGGDSKVLNVPLDRPELLDATKDGRRFLLANDVTTDGAGMVWTWSPIDGLERIGIYEAQGRMSPDGSMFAFPSGNRLLTIDATLQVKHTSQSLPGRLHWPDWSPDGTTLRFSIQALKDGTESLWETRVDLSNPRMILGPSQEAPRICCGTWVRNGRYYVFQGFGGLNQSDLWIVREKMALSRRKPVRLSNGPILLSWPLAAPDDSSKLFAIGQTSRGELVKFDRPSRTFTPFLGGISAADVSFSNDGLWAAYARYPEQTLWKGKSDGSEALQITKAPLIAFQPHWSPDGSRIAFMGQMPGKPWKAYVVDAGGGIPQEVKPDDSADQGIPTWAGDGRFMAFGELLFRKPESAMAVHVIDMGARRDTILPGSEGKWTPRWSPDGKYIAAQSPNGQCLFLYDCAARHWTEILQLRNIHDPTWSLDSEFVYFSADPPPGRALYRVHIRDREVEQLVGPESLPPMEYQWSGVAPDGSPLVLRSIKIQEIYQIDLALP